MEEIPFLTVLSEDSSAAHAADAYTASKKHVMRITLRIIQTPFLGT
jgi:hypothetical protein